MGVYHTPQASRKHFQVNKSIMRASSNDQMRGLLSTKELISLDCMNEKERLHSLSSWSLFFSFPHFSRSRDIIRNFWSRSRSRLHRRPVAVTNDMEEESEHSLLASTETSPRWAAISQSTRQLLVWPLPSYLHHLFCTVVEAEETHRPTDYLDGLRGVASLCVFFNHYLVQSQNEDIPTYGFGAGSHWNPVQLPFIRTLYSGSAMVCIFFVISGYVLSQRSIVAYRTEKYDKIFPALSSMAFRRGIRLFLPSIAAGLCGLAFVLLGILESEHPKDWTLSQELLNFARNVNQELFKVWSWEVNWRFWYSHQLWTIPVEFKCSMVLFLQILVVARCRTHIRFAIQLCALLYLFCIGRWEVATFIAGMVIAEINIICTDRKGKARAVWSNYSAPLSHDGFGVKRKCSFGSMIVQVLLWTCLIFGWYLTGYPPLDPVRTPGYSWLTDWWEVNPEYKFRFWLSQSAILIVFAISFLRPAQAIFRTKFARYLGKISFSLYLVHELLNRTLRLALWQAFLTLLHYKREEGADNKFEAGWFLGTIIYVPLVLWIADIFWRTVDIPTNKFSKWAERKCFKS